jgi:GTP-binding protein
MNHYRQATFLISAAQLSQLPGGNGIEVAFAGRSNAGKSSALNALTQQKNLARTSKTPGRTQLINLFSLDDQRRLVDLPGYGYAKVSENIKLQWQATLSEYLHQRESLKGLVLLMDCRHPLKDTDAVMIQWCQDSGLPCHLVLTKSDKLSRQQQMTTLREVEKAIADSPLFTVQLLSALNRQGLDQLEHQLDQWFGYA